jgi:hypothetical protein
MKMGTIVLPWRYDAAARHARQSINLRRPAILRYASWVAVFPISWDGPVSAVPDRNPKRLIAGTTERSRPVSAGLRPNTELLSFRIRKSLLPATLSQDFAIDDSQSPRASTDNLRRGESSLSFCFLLKGEAISASQFRYAVVGGASIARPPRRSLADHFNHVTLRSRMMSSRMSPHPGKHVLLATALLVLSRRFSGFAQLA